MTTIIVPSAALELPRLHRPALDLTRYHFRRDLRDLIVYGTWWLADDGGPKPCLVLMSALRQGWMQSTPAVVLLEQAWVWSEEIGQPQRAAKVAMEFVDALGMPAEVKSAFRVRSVIIDHLDDLLKMPPMPADMRILAQLGEAKITSREGGETIRHEEFTERV